MVTAVIGRDVYKTEVLTSSDHVVLADEPLEDGGGGLGPAPTEFLLVALASCTAITLRMYADRKKLSVTQIKVEVGLQKVATTSVLHRTIFVNGKLTDLEKQRMLQIAESCPVHKTLSSPIEIKTQLS